MNVLQSDSIPEALSWLETVLDEVSRDPYYAKSGEEVLLRVAFEIKCLAPSSRDAVLKALAQWLTSEDEYNFHAALSLINLLGVVDLIPNLKQLLNAVDRGERQLPGEHSREALEDTLRELESKHDAFESS